MKTQFRITLLLLLVVGISAILLQSCDKIQKATTFKVKYNLPDTQITIDTLTLLKSELVLFSQTNDAINIDSIIGPGAGIVDSVGFYKFIVSIVSPESAKFNWLNSARITLTPEGGAPVEIATSHVINATDRTIDFLVKDVDITASVKKPFIITLYGNLNGNISSLPVEVLMQSGLIITVSPL
jgi:hypothetical protein